MIGEATIVGSAVLFAGFGGAGVLRGGRDRLMRRCVRTTVVVTLKDGAAFKGVLYEADGRSLMLRQAELFSDPGHPVGVDGELLLDRHDVRYLQRP